MKVGVAGQGAFGVKHLEALQAIPGTEVITLTGGNQKSTEEVAKKFKIPHFTGDLAESLKQPGLEAMILATPTGMHAKQGEMCMRAGKHVQVEIPIADTLADSEEAWWTRRRKRAWSAWAATRAVSIPAISTCTRRSRPAS